jgi:hypothetical protein
MNSMSVEQEVRQLQEENRRLKALLELREDRSDLEHYQVQSRNKLLVLGIICFVLMGTTLAYTFVSKVETNREVNESRLALKRMVDDAQKKGVQQVP